MRKQWKNIMEKKEVKYTIYLKESPLGLKYLGKTQKNPFTYNGSGVFWKRHLKKHNFKQIDIKTTILYETTSQDDLKKMGIHYSNFFNVTNNDEFANLIDEQGQGGHTLYGENHPSKKFSENLKKYWTEENRIKQSEKMLFDNPSKKDYVKEKLSNIKKGFKFTDEQNKKKGKSGNLNVSKRNDVIEKISKSLIGRKLSEETKLKISQTLKNKHK
jgi:hypothetical protein